MSSIVNATISKDKKPLSSSIIKKKQAKSIFGIKSPIVKHAIIAIIALSISIFLTDQYRVEIATGLRSIYTYSSELMNGNNKDKETLEEILADLTQLQKQTNELQRKITLMAFNSGSIESSNETQQRFTMDDFEDYFRIKPIDEYEVDPALVPYLDKYVLEEDPFYLSNQESFDRLTKEFSPYIGRPSSRDLRYYIAWDEENSHYSLYARIDIPYNSVLGYFTGRLQERFKDVNDAWKYRATINDAQGEELYVVTDARFMGNWFHFLRLKDQPGNVKAYAVPYKNMWYTLFRTTRPVLAGEELFIGRSDVLQ